MSRELQYPAKCASCAGLMRVGDEADFVRDPAGGWLCTHVGAPAGCEDAKAAALPRAKQKRTFAQNFDVRTCSRQGCSAENDIAFNKGCAPPRCPYCRSPWLVDDLGAAADFEPVGEFTIPEFERP